MSILNVILKILPLPYFLSKGKGENKLSGYIDTSLFSYITPLMIIIVIIILLIATFNIQTLYTYFSTNVPINSLIIFLLFVSLTQAFNNNFQLYRTARFLRLIETLAEQPEITDEDASKLHRKLEKETPLLNTKQMHDVIISFKNFGRLIFSDNDARIIKSKLGYRIRLRRSDVGFNAGILVMLGLLGTFLGLLATIDAIGYALDTMSNLGSGGEVTAEQMGGFISALSQPLQGMGLAFSTSLYGLSGSLLIGFFNHLCGGSQDTFIEAVSRWVDNRIPQFDPEKMQDDPSNKAPDSDDLKTWLSGFVYLSVKTNKKIGALTHALVDTIKETGNIRTYLNKIATGQDNMSGRLQEVTNSIDVLSGHGAILVDNIVQSADSLNDLKEISRKSLSEMRKNLENISGYMNGMTIQQAAIAETSKVATAMAHDFRIAYQQNTDEIRQGIKGLAPSLEYAVSESAIATQGLLRQMITQVEEIKVTTYDFAPREKLQTSLSEVRDILSEMQEDYARSAADFSAYRATPETIRLHLARTEALLEQISKNHEQLTERLAALQTETVVAIQTKSSSDGELSNMAAELRLLLNEMNQKNERKFNDIFGINDSDSEK